MLFKRMKPGKIYSDDFNSVRYECFMQPECPEFYTETPVYYFGSIGIIPNIIVRSCIDKHPLGGPASASVYMGISSRAATRSIEVHFDRQMAKHEKHDRMVNMAVICYVAGAITLLIQIAVASHIGLLK